MQGSHPINRILLNLANAILSTRCHPTEQRVPEAPPPLLIHLKYLKIDVAYATRCFCGCHLDLQYDYIRTNLRYFLSSLLYAKQSALVTRGALSASAVKLPMKALENLVITDCPVTQLGWIMSRVGELRYVKRSCGVVRDAWKLAVESSEKGESELDDVSESESEKMEDDPEDSDVDVETCVSQVSPLHLSGAIHGHSHLFSSPCA